MTFANTFIFVVAFVLSWGLTWVIRRIALAKNMLDIPNTRSSHVMPTPRGGGVAFVGTFLLILPYWIATKTIPFHDGLYLMLSGFLIAMIGFLDDLYRLSARFRLLGHLAVAGLWIYGMHGMPPVSLCGHMIDTGWALNVLAVIYVVWLLNLYNFMDGIDGIAGVEAVSVTLIMALIYWMNGSFVYALMPLLLAASTAGFLYWNAPYARIFMGDAGSGFLGLILALLSLQSIWLDMRFFWCWLIVLAVFITDATLTLLVRACRKERLFEAHCSHAYQHASRVYGRHYPVTLSVSVINLFWLGPIAIAVSLGYIDGMLGMSVAYLPLVILAASFGAGKLSLR